MLSLLSQVFIPLCTQGWTCRSHSGIRGLSSSSWDGRELGEVCAELLWVCAPAAPEGGLVLLRGFEQ